MIELDDFIVEVPFPILFSFSFSFFFGGGGDLSCFL